MQSQSFSVENSFIAPKEATIPGWHYDLATIKTNSHQIANLSICHHPKTVLRSFNGAYKVLSRVDKHTFEFLYSLLGSHYLVKNAK